MTISKTDLSLVVLGLVGLTATLLNAISNALSSSDPNAAIILNPFNVEARISMVSRLLGAGSGNMEYVLSEAEGLVDVSPADARARSLLGEAKLLQGDRKGAEAVFQQAAQLARTEYVMLIRTIQFGFESGKYAETAQKIEALLRRWPARARDVAPLLARIVSVPEMRSQILTIIQKSPDVGRYLIRLLLADPNGPALTYSIVLDMQTSNIAVPADTLDEVINGLYRAGEPRIAFALFQTTMSSGKRQLAGYVFDPEFIRKPENHLFEWETAERPGTELQWLSNVDRNEIVVRFLGKPVKSVGLSQLVALPPGKYRLVTEYSAQNLQAPKGLFLRLGCAKGGPDIARLAFESVTHVYEEASVPFEIADVSCPAYRLSIRTDLLAESFRYRYEGILRIASIRIARETQ